MLSKEQITKFVSEGFIRINDAFSITTAQEARNILWKDTGCDPENPATWTQPVIRLGMYGQAPFIEAANTSRLLQAFDQLAGVGAWLPCRSMGSFPVRFPAAEDPGDGGWHVDAGFPGNDPADYFGWRINVHSKGRALLMLFLFSDVGEKDAPTRIRIGSHFDVARELVAHGEKGLSFMELAGKVTDMPAREEIFATGHAGTVYLCHPFLVHAAQPHTGTNPKFMAQPPLLLRHELPPDAPVMQAIQIAIDQ